MPDSPSGFVDFNQYYDQNQDEETRLMQEAMDRARGYDAKAQSALGRSQQEAKGHFNAHGVNAGEYTDSQADITKTASYGDYLAAKKDAENAYAGISAPSNNPFAEAVHGAILAQSPQYAQQAQAGMAGLNARDTAAAGGVRDFSTGANAHLQASSAERDRKAQEIKDRAAADAKLKSDYLAGLWHKYSTSSADSWGQGGVGSGGGRGVTDQDRGLWAQQLSSGQDSGDFNLGSMPGQTQGSRNVWGGRIENDAWGQLPVDATGNAPLRPGGKTKNGTGY